MALSPLSLLECVIAFGASVAVIVLPPTSGASQALAWTVFLSYLTGLTSLVRAYVGASFTLGIFDATRICTAGITLSIGIYELAKGSPAPAWPITAIVLAAVVGVLALVSFVLVVSTKGALRSVFGAPCHAELCPCQTAIFYSWCHVVPWFVTSVLILADGGGGAASTRPLLSIVTAPLILLAHALLWLDKDYARADPLRLIASYREWLTGGRKRERATVLVTLIHADQSYAKIPGVLAIVAFLSAILGVAQLIVGFLFPLVNVCLVAHPDDCTFAPLRILWGLLITAGVCFAETARFIICASMR